MAVGMWEICLGMSAGQQGSRGGQYKVCVHHVQLQACVEAACLPACLPAWLPAGPTALRARLTCQGQRGDALQCLGGVGSLLPLLQLLQRG